MKKRNYNYTTDLESLFFQRHKCEPFDLVQELKAHGLTHAEAFELIQEEMDEIWNEYRAQKKKEKEAEVFHPVSEEDTPFHFTPEEQDILNHTYKVMQEAPVTIPPEYDLTGEQLSFVWN